jgi:hypothetical protein
MPNIPNSPPPTGLSPDGKVPSPGKSKKLLDQYSEFLRNRHYSLRTEKTYIGWVRQYILYHNKRHPREMGVAEINEFITHLVNQKTVSASTHTAPAVGAGEIKPLVRFSFSTEMCSTSSWTKKPWSRSVPRSPSASRLCSHGKKPGR